MNQRAVTVVRRRQWRESQAHETCAGERSGNNHLTASEKHGQHIHQHKWHHSMCTTPLLDDKRQICAYKASSILQLVYATSERRSSISLSAEDTTRDRACIRIATIGARLLNNVILVTKNATSYARLIAAIGGPTCTRHRLTVATLPKNPAIDA